MDNPYTAPTAEVDDVLPGNDTYMPSMFAVSGRIGRLRYVAYSSMASLLCLIVIGALFGAVFAATAAGNSMLVAVAGVLIFICYIPMFAIGFIYARRRLNDTDNTGWLSLLLFVPLVGILFWLYLLVAPGTQGRNRYGPAPGPNNTLAMVGAIILPMVAIVGVLAAVAIPAYQEYVKKARHVRAVPAPQDQQSR